MTTPAAIRRAGARDAFAVAALHLQWGRELGVTSDAGYLDRFADAWLRDVEHRPFWLAEIENRPLGAVGVHLTTTLPLPGDPAGRRTAQGTFLFVTPTFRRCGIGGQLTREVATWARAEGVEIAADLTPLGAAAPGIGRRLARRVPSAV